MGGRGEEWEGEERSGREKRSGKGEERNERERRVGGRGYNARGDPSDRVRM